MKALVIGATVAVLAAGGGYFLGYRAASEKTLTTEEAEREAEFARAMTGVALEGTFTSAVSGEDRLREESYFLESVEKVAGDIWMFRARIRFGDEDLTLPVPVRLVWAGDTPMVTLTDASLPGLGTFTARVIFYRDRYAGLWWGSDASGHQFGSIVPQDASNGSAP